MLVGGIRTHAIRFPEEEIVTGSKLVPNHRFERSRHADVSLCIAMSMSKYMDRNSFELYHVHMAETFQTNDYL